jgi:hypothetical protein
MEKREPQTAIISSNWSPLKPSKIMPSNENKNAAREETPKTNTEGGANADPTLPKSSTGQ